MRRLMREDMKVINSESRRKEFEEREKEKRVKKEEKKEKRKRQDEEEPEEDRQILSRGRQSTASSSGGDIRGQKRGSEEAEMEEAFKKMEDKEEEDIRRTLRRWDGEDEGLGDIPRDAQGRPDISEIEREVEAWICEVKAEMEELEEEDFEEAWDDVRGGILPLEKVVEARTEEVGYMVGRNIWSVRPIEESWRKTGKGPTSTRFVDTNKGGPGYQPTSHYHFSRASLVRVNEPGRRGALPSFPPTFLYRSHRPNIPPHHISYFLRPRLNHLFQR
jgi:hypothetical protein